MKKKPVKAKPVKTKVVKRSKQPTKAPVKTVPKKVTKQDVRVEPKRFPVKKIVKTEEPIKIIKTLEVAKKVLEVPTIERVSWSDLPKNIPARIRFMMKVSLEQCTAAASWPFTFAKFLKALPNKICALDFALLFMSQEHSDAALAKISNLSPDEVRSRISRVQGDIEDVFSSECNEIFRKWWGSTAQPRALLEPYLISKVDFDFQLMVSEAVLHSIRRQVTH